MNTPRPIRLPLLAALAGLCLAPTVARSQTDLPTGFADSLVVAGLDTPTAFDFVPGSTHAQWRLLFVEQKTARIRMLANGALSTTDPVLTVPNVQTGGGEQGLLGIALDPQFPARPYVYIHADDNQAPRIRISRFTLSGDLAFAAGGQMTADPASRFDLVTNIPDNADNHNGGTVRFGPDGYLYVSLGEDANPCAAQDTTSLRGVILRLRTDGLPAGPGRALRSQIVPATNPYATHPDSNARLVWTMGLRNPFRFQIDPNTGALLVGDVGQDTWEEMNYVTGGGRNGGWPFREGYDAYGSCTGRSSANLLEPIAVMGHNEAFSVMSAGVYRPAGGPYDWPVEYHGDLLYSDYYGGMLRRMKWTGSQWTAAAPVAGQPSSQDWAIGFGAVTDYRVGPDGGLWYCRQWGSPVGGEGEIRRILNTNAPPDTGAPPPSGPRLSMRAWPQPARTTVNLDYTLPGPRRLRLTVHDMSGRLVRLLAEGLVGSGTHQTTWDGHDEQGRRAPPGVYWARLDAGLESRSVRIALVP
jgi:glucose/arabinose dehydrogenase